MDEDCIEKFKLFKRQAEKLYSNDDFFKNLSFALEYNASEGVKTSFKDRPDDKVIKSTLIDLRPFLLEGEPVNFYHICDLLYRNFHDAQLQEKVKEVKEAWSILLERKRQGPAGGIRLKIGEKDILSEENLNTWLYGEYFHLDKRKIKVLEQMNLTPMGGLSFLLFLDLLQRLSALVFHLEKTVIDQILDA